MAASIRKADDYVFGGGDVSMLKLRGWLSCTFR
jgi:hypothetical protein